MGLYVQANRWHALLGMEEKANSREQKVVVMEIIVGMARSRKERKVTGEAGVGEVSATPGQRVLKVPSQLRRRNFQTQGKHIWCFLWLQMRIFWTRAG